MSDLCRPSQMDSKDICLRNPWELLNYHSHQVRRATTENGQEVWVAIDVVGAATGSKAPREYWRKTKKRLEEDGYQLSPNLLQLKIEASDGKSYLTEVLTREQVFRVLQAIPSKKAEPFRLWIAHLANERLQEIENPAKGVKNSIRRWKQMGKSDRWIDERIKGVGVRNAETDVLQAHGISSPKDFAHFTDRTNVAVYGHTAKVEKAIRKVPANANLRDASSITELALLGFHESACTMGIENRNAQGKAQIDGVYDVVGGIVSTAREKLLEAFGSASLAPGEISD